MSDKDWEFEFAGGTVTTVRLEKDISKGGQTADDYVEPSIIVEQDEAIIVEESLNRQGAVRVREVPDGPDIPEDTNVNSRNTVQVLTPDDQERAREWLPQSKYIVTNWEISLINNEFYELSLEMYKISGTGNGFGRTFGRNFGI
jgi:hypothetical protein